MPGTNYLCIDDQRDTSSIQLLLDKLGDGINVIFTRQSPSGLEKQLDEVSSAASRTPKGDSFGLLIDLRLDMEADEHGERVPYRGPTLAQEIRTRMVEGVIPSFPIVLWSIDEKFVTSYYGDDTSHDLFDAVYGKDEDVVKRSGVVGLEMFALAVGYRALSDVNDVEQLARALQRTACIGTATYADFFGECVEAVAKRSKHAISRLLLTSLINRSGLLVDEMLLAARLGVDYAGCTEEWNRFLTQIEDAQYKGPFFQGWRRWWWYDVENWWTCLGDGQRNLRRLAASERVHILNTIFDASLVPATAIVDGYSSKFFAVCVATSRPLDPIDGLRVTKSNVRSWNDTYYVSAAAALERVNKDRWKIHPSDHARFDLLKKGG
ncbi:hypothetical protein [Rhodanobacter terrae]|uniref:Uncharacterized protein n=1 Tax=Rhodanobacter terrae TaxID=418647 RepID=A0ABW0T1P2_9GAMM